MQQMRLSIVGLASIILVLSYQLVGADASSLSVGGTDLAKLELRGAVSSITEKQKPAGSSIVLETLSQFNSRGNLVEYTARSVREESAYPEGKGLRTVFNYDIAGKRTTATSFQSDGSIYERTKYDRDALGTFELEAKYYADDTFVLLKILKLDKSQPQTETVIYTSYPPHLTKSVSNYDSKHQKTIVLHEPQGLKTVKIHDPQGHVTEVNSFRTDELISMTNYKYDNHGNSLEETIYDKNGKLKEKIVNSYKYDDVGNWTEKVSNWVLRDGNASEEYTLTKREIAYFGPPHQ